MKMNIFKAIFLSSVVAVLLLTMFVSTAAAEVYTPIEDFDYSVTGTEITLECYNGSDTVINIAPSYTIGGVEYIVTAISGYTQRRAPYGAFEDCADITSVTLPTTVTAVGDADYPTAFAGCSSLSTITIYGNPTIADKAIGYVYDEGEVDYVLDGSVITVKAWSGDDTVVSNPQSYAMQNDITFEGLEGVVLQGYQPSADMSGATFSIRFVGTVDSLKYKQVGFVVSESNYGKSWMTGSRNVYSALNVALSDGSVMKEAIKASDFENAAYLTAIAVKNIPNNTNLSFTIVPYVVNRLGAKVYGNAGMLNYSGEFVTLTPVTAHIVTFKDHDGSVLKTEVVADGKNATAPTVPARDGYTFKGWDAAFDNVTDDLSVLATYAADTGEKNTLEISYVNNGDNTVTVTVAVIGDVVKMAGIDGYINFDHAQLTYSSSLTLSSLLGTVNYVSEESKVYFALAGTTNISASENLFSITFSHEGTIDTDLEMVVTDIYDQSFATEVYQIIGGHIVVN